MPDRRRITDVNGLTQVHLNYRDAQRGVGEPLCFDIIWPDLIVDALNLVTADEMESALMTAGLDAQIAGRLSLLLAIAGLTANPWTDPR